MPKTEVRGSQIRDTTIGRADLNVATPGLAVITKIVEGPGISISYTGADVGTGDVTITAGGSNNVVGPASATDNAIARYDTTTGKLIQDSTIFIADSGILQFGGTTNAFPALKRVTTGLEVRLADDSALTTIQASEFRVGVNPALSGAIRLSTANGIVARNAANTADVVVIRIGSGDQIEIGPTTNNISIITGNRFAVQATGVSGWNLYNRHWHPEGDNVSDLGTSLLRIRDVYVAGTGNFGGLGSTPLNATNLTSGTVPDARLSSNVALKNINNNFTVGQNVTGNLTTSGVIIAEHASINQTIYGLYRITLDYRAGTDTARIVFLHSGLAPNTGRWDLKNLGPTIRFVTMDDNWTNEITRFSLDRSGNVITQGTITAEGGKLVLAVTGGFPGGTTTFLRADGTFATPAGSGGIDTTGSPIATDIPVFFDADTIAPSGLKMSGGILSTPAGTSMYFHGGADATLRANNGWLYLTALNGNIIANPGPSNIFTVKRADGADAIYMRASDGYTKFESSGNIAADFRSSHSRNGYTQWTLNDGSIIGYAGSGDILTGSAAQYFTILSSNVMLIRSQANQIEINPATYVSFANKSVRDAMFGGYGEAYLVGSPVSGWWECNLAAHNVFDVYATAGNFNVSIFNARSPVTSFTLIVHYGSTVTAIGWPTNVRWPNDIVPTPSANGRTDIFSFITRDGGGIWLGCVNANLRWY